MAGPLDDLRAASFRGAHFLCPNDHLEEGRNVIAHHYPGSSVLFAEDNGGYPPEFTLTCIIHGPNWLADYSRLRTALNRPGPGTLKHPWYGSQTCAAKKWRAKRRDDDLGVIELEVCFLATTPSAIFPAQITGIAASISTLAAGAIGAIFTGFSAGFSVPTSPYSQQSVGTLMGNVATSVSVQFPTTGDVATAASSISSEL